MNGYYLNVVKRSISLLPPRKLWDNNENTDTNGIMKFFRTKLEMPEIGEGIERKGSVFYIDNSYQVKGIGLVLSGINRGKKINIGDTMILGPFSKIFYKVKVKSLHNDDRTEVNSLDDHHRGCVCVKVLDKSDAVKKTMIRKGMVLLSDEGMINKYVGFRFCAAVSVFGNHSSTLRTGYCPVIHVGSVKQVAKMILPENTDKQIKSGDVAKVIFKFRQRPEYVEPGSLFIFRSGEIHGIGYVLETITIDKDNDPFPEPIKKKFCGQNLQNLQKLQYMRNNNENMIQLK